MFTIPRKNAARAKTLSGLLVLVSLFLMKHPTLLHASVAAWLGEYNSQPSENGNDVVDRIAVLGADLGIGGLIANATRYIMVPKAITALPPMGSALIAMPFPSCRFAFAEAVGA